MNLAQIGLALNFVGAVFIGLSSQIGLAAGFGGPIVWKAWSWRVGNVLGWVLLSVGFLLQLFYGS
jgi:hypothetical protein